MNVDAAAVASLPAIYVPPDRTAATLGCSFLMLAFGLHALLNCCHEGLDDFGSSCSIHHNHFHQRVNIPSVKGVFDCVDSQLYLADRV
jgi:hypothetical protein